MKLKVIDEPERSLYIAELILTVILGIVGLTIYIALPYAPWLELVLKCKFKELTGIPCIACGGSRAALCAFKGRFLKSIYYNGAVFYGMALAFWFFISHTLCIITKGKIKGLKWRDIYWKLGLIILFLQYIIKLVVPGYRI
jgi:hypothetical protein